MKLTVYIPSPKDYWGSYSPCKKKKRTEYIFSKSVMMLEFFFLTSDFFFLFIIVSLKYPHAVEKSQYYKVLHFASGSTFIDLLIDFDGIF